MNTAALRVLFITAFMQTLVAHAALAGAAVEAGRNEIRVLEVGGEVTVTMRGTPRDVAPRDEVELAARIVTGADGHLSLAQGKTTIAIAGDTDVEIPEAARDGQLIARLVQHRGNVFYDVAPRGLDKLRVESPYLVAVVKGTQFNVAVQEDGTTIALFEGLLEIRTPDGSEVIELNAGEIAVRSREDAAIRVVRMDAEPLPEPQAAVRDNANARGAATPEAARGENGTDFGRLARDAGTDIALAAGVDTLQPGTLDLGAPRGVDFAGDGKMIGLDTAAGVDASVAADAPLRVDAGIAIDSGALDVSAGVGAGVADLGITVGADLGGASLSVDADASVDLGAAGVSLGLDAGADLGAGAVAAGLDVGAALGGVTADVGLDAGIDLGAGDIDIGLDAGVDLGGATADLGLDAGVDLGTGDVDLDAGVDLGGATVDVGLDVGGDGASVDLGVGGIDAGLDLGDDGIGIELGGIEIGLGGGGGGNGGGSSGGGGGGGGGLLGLGLGGLL